MLPDCSELAERRYEGYKTAVSGAFQFVFPRLTGFVRKLVIGLLSAFVAQLLLNFVGMPVSQWFALHASELGLPTLWQLVSYVAVEPTTPAGVISTLVSLLFIWLIVAPFELSYGARRTAELCLTGTLAAGAAAVLTAQLVPAYTQGPLYGAGPITYAGIAAMAVTLRGGRLALFGVWSMTPRQLLALLVGFSVLMFLADRNLVRLAAALTSIAAGVAYVRWMQRPRIRKRGRSARRPPFQVLQGGAAKDDDRPRYLN